MGRLPDFGPYAASGSPVPAPSPRQPVPSSFVLSTALIREGFPPPVYSRETEALGTVSCLRPVQGSQ